jgi:hypothetical protein
MPVKDSGSVNPIAGWTDGDLTITVGVHSDDAEHTHAGGEGLTVGDIATFHEFGTQTVPQRSFIRAWFDEGQDEHQRVIREELDAAAKGVPLQTALERIALRLEGSCKQRMAQGIPPPLSPVTVARKGSSTPLIDTGQLRGAIRARVSNGGEER